MGKDFTIVIDADKKNTQYWKDLWLYRELFYILAWRDIVVRYKQTAIGVTWAILRPLLTMVIFVLVFGKIAKLPSEGVPYPIFVFSATLVWTFFSTAFSDASNSLISNANLISKVYFPRIILPASSVIVALVDFIISFTVLLMLMIVYRYMPHWQILTLPVFLALAFCIAFGFGLYISALNVKYRDFRFVVPFIVQIGLYISPVGFSTTIVPDKYKLFYYFNPMVAVIDGCRWAISGGKTTFNGTELIISIIVTVLICLTGILYFRKTEKSFADVI